MNSNTVRDIKGDWESRPPGYIFYESNLLVTASVDDLLE
jgi:hypothetical protein